MKLIKGKSGRYFHFCPGCEQLHLFAVDKPFSNGAVWSFNGNYDKPTFNPSMKIGNPVMCHYFLTDGVIDFLPDSHEHKLRGKVNLPDIPQEYADWETDVQQYLDT